jgi:hypothetical protein
MPLKSRGRSIVLAHLVVGRTSIRCARRTLSARRTNQATIAGLDRPPTGRPKRYKSCAPEPFCSVIIQDSRSARALTVRRTAGYADRNDFRLALLCRPHVDRSPLACLILGGPITWNDRDVGVDERTRNPLGLSRGVIMLVRPRDGVALSLRGSLVPGQSHSRYPRRRHCRFIGAHLSRNSAHERLASALLARGGALCRCACGHDLRLERCARG